MIYRSTLFCRLQVYWDARYVDGGTIVTIHGYLISWSDKWCRLPRLLHVPDCAYLVLCVSPFGHAFRFALPFPWICMRGILLVFDLHIIWPFVAVVVCCLISSMTEHSCSSGFVPYRSRALVLWQWNSSLPRANVSHFVLFFASGGGWNDHVRCVRV